MQSGQDSIPGSDIIGPTMKQDHWMSIRRARQFTSDRKCRAFYGGQLHRDLLAKGVPARSILCLPLRTARSAVTVRLKQSSRSQKSLAYRLMTVSIWAFPLQRYLLAKLPENQAFGRLGPCQPAGSDLPTRNLLWAYNSCRSPGSQKRPIKQRQQRPSSALIASQHFAGYCRQVFTLPQKLWRARCPPGLFAFGVCFSPD